MCYNIGVHGAALLDDQMTVMTHCNAGVLQPEEQALHWHSFV